jgi:flagellin
MRGPVFFAQLPGRMRHAVSVDGTHCSEKCLKSANYLSGMVFAPDNQIICLVYAEATESIMSFSINTNAAALNALQYLNGTTRALDETQLRVNTGLKVRNGKDNAAVFAIAQNMRAERSGLEAVKQSLDRAKSLIDVSSTVAESIQTVLIDMKEKLVAASDAGLDANSRTALLQDFTQLRDQLALMTRNATFNGTNIIDGPAAPPSKPAALTAIVSTDGLQNISIPRQNLQPLAAGTSVAPAVSLPPGTIIELASDSTFATAQQAQDLIARVDNSIRNVSTSLTIFGSGARTIEQQQTFITKLSDSLDAGIGNLVDADLSRESAKLQALQVKQQLGLQALSIANGAPQSILALFRN